MTPAEYVTVFLLRLIAASHRRSVWPLKVVACGCPTCRKERIGGFVYAVEHDL
jgi:hypothetical protein